MTTYAQAKACEPLRIIIEDRIRNNGVKNFSVTVMDADATSTGRVVGTCEQGSKKLVYTLGGQPPAPSPSQSAASAPKATAKPVRGEVITECLDGWVYRDGACRK